MKDNVPVFWTGSNGTSLVFDASRCIKLSLADVDQLVDIMHDS